MSDHAKFRALVLLILWPICSRAALSTESFDAANKLYEQSKFNDAATAYQKMLDSGQASTALYFNLGNAWFKAGQIGRAVASYRQGEQLSPRDPDIRANLQFARNQVQGPTLMKSRWQRWLRSLSLNEWTELTAGAVWLWFFLLIVLQWRPGLKATLRNWVSALGLGAAVACGCLVAALYQQRFTGGAIVIAHEATARHGPLEESPSAFSVNDGAELRVLDHKDDWLQVSTGPARIGWLKRDQVVLMPGV
jgi:tetratricopeptide (TPR) repeat protein